jgi:glutamate racemase
MTRKNKQQGPIGIFDSGVGGLSVLREVRDQYPSEDLIYIADQIHVPYGTRSREEVLKFSEGIVRFLLGEGVKLVVLACNTASAAALAHLRKIYPALPFVGMEPAVKPAAEETSTGVVGILATPATFQGELYASTMERFARGVKVLQDTCPGLVDQIEAGMIDHPRTREILEKALKPMLDQGIDKVVMGCTHYPFVIPIIEEIAGDGVRVIDPAPAVARQTGRLLEAYHLEADRKKGSVEFLTTGDPESFSRTIAQLVGLETAVGQVNWHDGDLEKSSD